MNDTKKKFDLMYIAGMLSDCQELVGPELNDEDGWVAPDNAQDGHCCAEQCQRADVQTDANRDR